MTRFALGAKWGIPKGWPAKALGPPLKRSGINKDPKANEPIPTLNCEKKCLRFTLRGFSEFVLSSSIIVILW
jgi:hypothetical protein